MTWILVLDLGLIEGENRSDPVCFSLVLSGSELLLFSSVKLGIRTRTPLRSCLHVVKRGINIFCFCLVGIIFSIRPTSAALFWLPMNRASVCRTVVLSQGAGPPRCPHYYQAALKPGVERKSVYYRSCWCCWLFLQTDQREQSAETVNQNSQ